MRKYKSLFMWKFIKDFFVYGFSSIFSKIVAVLLMPIYTNILTREEYGAMAMLVSVKGIIDLLSNLNIHSGIARDYCEKGVKRSTLVSTGLWSILSLSCTVLIIMLLTKAFWIDTVLELPDYQSSFVLVLLSVPAGGLVSYFSILTRFKKKPALYATGSIISLVLRVLVSIYTIVVLRMGIVGFFFAVLIEELFSISYFGYINRQYIAFIFDWDYLKRVLKFSVPVLPAIAAGWIDTSLGQILMAKYVSLTDLGVYSVALQFASIFTLIGTALNNVWSPFLYENYRNEGFQSKVERLFLMFVFILCIVSCTLSLISREMVFLLANSNYQDASNYLALLCIPMSFHLLFPIVSSGISVSRDTKHTSIAYLMGSIFNLLFLFIFLPKIGVYIVPLGLGISRVITYLYMSYITQKKGLLKLPNNVMAFFTVLITFCFFIVYNQISLLCRLTIMLLIDGALLYWAAKRLQLKNMIASVWENRCKHSV